MFCRFAASGSSAAGAGCRKVTASMAARNHGSSKQAKAFQAHFEVEHLDTHEVGHLAAKARVKAVLRYHMFQGNKTGTAPSR